MKVFCAMLFLTAVCGCETAPRNIGNEPTASTLSQEHPIDGLSRNVGENQGGAIRDSMTLRAPPVRPDYASDR